MRTALFLYSDRLEGEGGLKCYRTEGELMVSWLWLLAAIKIFHADTTYVIDLGDYHPT